MIATVGEDKVMTRARSMGKSSTMVASGIGKTPPTDKKMRHNLRLYHGRALSASVVHAIKTLLFNENVYSECYFAIL